MDAQATARIPQAFLTLPDPRHHNVHPKLIDILTIALFAISRLCRLSLNLLKNEKTQKPGIATKRKICGWNNDYLLKVAQG